MKALTRGCARRREASQGCESGATRMSTALPRRRSGRAWASESAQSGPRLRSVVPVVEATTITTGERGEARRPDAAAVDEQQRRDPREDQRRVRVARAAANSSPRWGAISLVPRIASGTANSTSDPAAASSAWRRSPRCRSGRLHREPGHDRQRHPRRGPARRQPELPGPRVAQHRGAGDALGVDGRQIERREGRRSRDRARPARPRPGRRARRARRRGSAARPAGDGAGRRGSASSGSSSAEHRIAERGQPTTAVARRGLAPVRGAVQEREERRDQLRTSGSSRRCPPISISVCGANTNSATSSARASRVSNTDARRHPDVGGQQRDDDGRVDRDHGAAAESGNARRARRSAAGRCAGSPRRSCRAPRGTNGRAPGRGRRWRPRPTARATRGCPGARTSCSALATTTHPSSSSGAGRRSTRGSGRAATEGDEPMLPDRPRPPRHESCVRGA